MVREYVSYVRVSTKSQAASGLGLEAQRHAIGQFLASNGSLIREFIETESGSVADRPELMRALALCRAKNAVLVVAKLDRLARNVAFLAQLMDGGAEFVALDLPHANRFTLHIMASLAEYERELISGRTRAALAAAKARGVILGGARVGHEVSRHARAGAAASARLRSAKANARARDLAPEVAEVRRDLGAGATLRQIADALTARGFTSPRGHAMTAATVARIEARAA